MSAQCGTCGGPVHDTGHLCTGCTGALTLDLQRLGGYRHTDGRWIPGLLADLLTAGTGAARIPQQGGGTDDWGRTLDHAYPATCSTAGQGGNPAALALHHEIRTDLLGWVRILLDHVPPPCPHDSCTNTRPQCATRAAYRDPDHNPAQWLEQRAHLIRRQEWAPAMLADLDRHITRAEALVDLPAALTVPCPWCMRRVPMDRDVPLIECQCGARGTLPWWIEQVAPPLPVEPMTLAELPDWLRTRGYDVTYEQARTWSARGQLPHLATRGQRDAKMYAARTVLETAEQMEARRVIPTSMTR